MEDQSLTLNSPLLKLKSWKWWWLVSLNILFLIIGQAAAVILGRLYYDKGGNSKWMATMVQTVAFPILFVPCLFISSSEDSGSDSSTNSSPSLLYLVLLYVVLGAMIAADNMLYSVGLLYLTASTYSLLCATQLVFNAVFSYFINSQKFTMLIFNSVVVLTLSAALLAVDDDSGEAPSGVSRSKYALGFATTIGASALYSLLLSLMQLSFQKFIKKETFSVVLYMQIYTSLVATCISVVGLFGSGEWKGIKGEMNSFTSGRTSYVMTLVGISVSWQVCSVGVVGLTFVVSSLFSNVISTLSLAVTPIGAVVVLGDKMKGLKIITLLLALWGFTTYSYQNYIDERKIRRKELTEDSEA